MDVVSSLVVPYSPEPNISENCSVNPVILSPEDIHGETARLEVPKEGMLFDSLDEASDFYHRFAKQEGFAVSKRTTTKGINGDFKFVTLACSRAGKARVRTSNPVRPRPQTKIDCPARISMVLQSEGKWKFNRVVLDHNHDQSPSKVKYLKCNRVIDENIKRRLELNDKAGIKLNKTYDSLQIEVGGPGKLSVSSKDCRNYLDRHRRLQLVEGDAQAMRNYFRNMTIDNSDFFYEMEIDDHGRLLNVFWVGMSSTQRSEGINAYFDGFVHSKTTLKQFVGQYENAMAYKVENERQEDVKSWNSFIPLIREGDQLEKQFQSVYTNNKVKEFHKEFVGKLSCMCAKTHETDFVSEYEVKEWMNFGEEEDKMRKQVTFNFTRLFEFKGMVCRHQLLVWFQLDIQRVPEKYVLKRWCKNVKRAHTKVKISYDNSSCSIDSERHDILCKSVKEVVDLAEDSPSKFEMTMKRISELKQALMLASDNSVLVEDGVRRTQQGTIILDPKGLSRKGRPPKNRMQCIVEKIIKKKK